MSATASAADIHLDPSVAAGMGAVLEGKIEFGDFDKFKNFVLENDKVVEIYLASPGGNLNEALKIGVLTRVLQLSTVVPSKTLTTHDHELAVAQHDLRQSKANYMCGSACFFVFVAGINRKSDGLRPAILGIHRPSLSDKDRKTLEYDQVAAAADQIRSTVVKYLTIMDAPVRYAAEMFAVPSGRIRWIRNDEFDADLEGFIPELKDKLNAKCATHADLENRGDQPRTITGEQSSGGIARAMPLKRGQTLLDCERDFEVETVVHARQEFVKSWVNQSTPPAHKEMPPSH
jgi:hypothetical protein